MKLLLVRHGVAEDKIQYGQTGRPDSTRPLTGDGRRKMRKGARGLKRIFPAVDVLGTSPFARAMQTAEILRGVYPKAHRSTLPSLKPGMSSARFLAWLKTQSAKANIAVVGHEPGLSSLASRLLTGRNRGVLELKKGGACLIEFHTTPGPGRGMLIWHVKPSMLRRLDA